MLYIIPLILYVLEYKDAAFIAAMVLAMITGLIQVIYSVGQLKKWG